MGHIPLSLVALTSAGLLSALVAPSWAGSVKPELPAQIEPLARELQSYGFQIRVAPPPKHGVYGLFEGKTKTLWIAPVTIPLGIARQTFLHEAVHAIQSCPTGLLTPLGDSVTLNPVVEREINAILLRDYHHTIRTLEREAFLMQAQQDAVPRLQKLLKDRCKSRF